MNYMTEQEATEGGYYPLTDTYQRYEAPLMVRVLADMERGGIPVVLVPTKPDRRTGSVRGFQIWRWRTARGY